MKRHLLLLAILITHSFHIISSDRWGQNGHRIVGEIAQSLLTGKAQKNIKSVLGNETLAEVSNFMDFIKADEKYQHMNPWHYCTIPDGLTYEEAGTPEEQDAIVTIQRLIAELKSGNFTDEDEAFALKCLVHLVGDIHQPLHVGNGEDRGGNDVRLEYFYQSSNLHRVWDTEMIESQNYSYTEYVDWINHATTSEIADWQNDTVLDWAYESMELRENVYDFQEDKKLGYRYVYENRQLVNRRLLQAGVRLAGILNDIYG